jgi:predicted acetyltransferase
MLRVNDVKLALEARGYAVDGEAHLEIDDDLIPQNRGRFVLTVKSGRGTVRRGGRGSTRLDIRGLAAIYSGFLSCAQAAAVGHASGDDVPLFAGPVPWMADLF